MTKQMVKEYYADRVRVEWRRLVRNAYHRIELDTTLYFITKYLPKNGLILDAGGGPGRYTLELARRGYNVVLLDAVQANLDFSKRQVRRAKLEKHVKEFRVGSIDDLSQFETNHFDGVICTGGPLSHLLQPDQRAKAISELVRVAKPGAPILVSVMAKLGALVSILLSALNDIGQSHFKRIVETGDYLGGYGFTACHFYLPEELRRDFTIEGVQILEMAGLEGISAHHDRAINKLAKDKSRYMAWIEAHYETCTHPAVVGMSEHMLIVCRKRLQNDPAGEIDPV